MLTVYTAEYCLYILLFLGSEGGHGTVAHPLRRLVVDTSFWSHENSPWVNGTRF